MKRVVMIFLVMTSVYAGAQSSWGLKGGMTIGNAVSRYHTVRQFHYPLAGIYLGIEREIPSGPMGNFFITPSFEWTQRGFMDKVYTGSQVTSRHKVLAKHGIFSLGFVRKMMLDNGNTKLYTALLPFAGYGFGGKEKYLGGATDSSFSLSYGDIRRTYNRDTTGKLERRGNDLVRWDAGIGMSLGIEFSGGLRLQGTYRISLRNNLPAGTAENSLRFTGFAIGITYLINNYY